MILSLPEFKYHEANLNCFRESVMNARKDPHNANKNKNYLYLKGDGSYPAQEFTWNKKSKTLTVKSIGDGVDPSRIDIWQINNGKLEIIE